MVATTFSDRLNGFLDRLPLGAGKYVAFGVRLVRELATAGISDRAMTLAAQAFTSILPVLLLLTTFPRSGAIDRTISMFGLGGGLGPDDSTGTYASLGVVGALMTLISATSLARALDRMYVGVWEVRGVGIRGWWRWLVVIAVLAAASVAQAVVLVDFTDSNGRIVLSVAETFVIWTLTWAAVPRILSGQQMDRVDLCLLGAVSGVGITAFVIATEIGYATVFHSARASFGAIGVVFASIGWLFIFMAVVVVATVLVKVIRTPDQRQPAVEHPVDTQASG